ncbi:hypothetical protein LCGC14_2722970 [marine sediment metagenome]|uniref:Uncharacterized protein n=1 Tax=marine sediment metagenome TaxID=412755 RepID=A0A0F8ZX12_9ZZZZ
MSKLAALQGKSGVYQIGEIELEIKPLNLDDMDLFSMDKNASTKEQTESSLKLIDKVLTDSVPDSTPEERKGVALEYMEPLMKAIMEVNRLKDPKGSAMDAIKARQTQSQNKGQ